MNTIGGADLGGGPGKLHRVVPAVHADGHAPLFALLAFGADHVGKALGGPADDVDVHIVKPCVHGAPEAGGAEFQGAVEPGFNFLRVVSDGLQLGPLRLAQGGASKPFLVFLHEVHSDAPPLMNAARLLTNMDNV